MVEHGNGRFIDLRSDTVTKPTEAMRKAMASARVGDDVLGDDPTVKALEERTAERLGKEAALFFPSGTMANLAALMVHASPGGEVYLGADSHIYFYEAGGLSRIAGLMPRLFDDEGGMPAPEAVAALLREPNIHFPTPGLLCLENTHNRAGGLTATAEATEDVAAVAREAGIPVHLDGARLFNAAAALETTPAALAADVDSVMVSLSKALSAPVGSLLAGEGAFVAEARRVRKLLGGGMRQVGVLAAAGLVALDTPLDELRRQHETARRLAEGLSALDGVHVDVDKVQTNIVLVELAQLVEGAALPSGGPGETPASRFVAGMAERGVGAVAMGPNQVRFVTHRHVDGVVVPDVVAAAEAVLQELSSPRSPVG